MYECVVELQKHNYKLWTAINRSGVFILWECRMSAEVMWGDGGQQRNIGERSGAASAVDGWKFQSRTCTERYWLAADIYGQFSVVLRDTNIGLITTLAIYQINVLLLLCRQKRRPLEMTLYIFGRHINNTHLTGPMRKLYSSRKIEGPFSDYEILKWQYKFKKSSKWKFFKNTLRKNRLSASIII